MSDINRSPKSKHGVKNVHATNGTATNYSFNQLFTWINQILSTEFSDLKELSSGAAYCQVIEVLFPGSVPLHKVYFTCNLDAEHMHNYKILNEAFETLGIIHSIEMTRLAKGSRIEHLQFMQWLRKFYQVNYDGRSYNPRRMRQGKDFKIGCSNQETKKGYEHVGPRYYKNLGKQPKKME